MVKTNHAANWILFPLPLWDAPDHLGRADGNTGSDRPNFEGSNPLLSVTLDLANGFRTDELELVGREEQFECKVLPRILLVWSCFLRMLRSQDHKPTAHMCDIGLKFVMCCLSHRRVSLSPVIWQPQENQHGFPRLRHNGSALAVAPRGESVFYSATAGDASATMMGKLAGCHRRPNEAILQAV
ncbi:hypothetical protein Bbelb_137410 [Branchiostoma belcheri]|nr:hypothetical protein Bbelb_137410 [Branchiostoma belcheri]